MRMEIESQFNIWSAMLIELFLINYILKDKPLLNSAQWVELYIICSRERKLWFYDHWFHAITQSSGIILYTLLQGR